ncbi:uncharacterized protein LOC128958538 [Oppia nitens]|uniref:uncharacterized protein LOC128958538 n=1 Tax=Oppia nitens TaxID=1686743 RepID=UPI0023DB597A|nr:uncharacterized protein LOC128958538 [Oppia nitens]
MNTYLIVTVFLCTVCLGHTFGGIIGINNYQQLIGTQDGNATEECKKDACCLKIIDDIVQCVFDKEDPDTIAKHFFEPKFFCCIIGIEFDCANSIAKSKCETKDRDILLTKIDHDKDLLNEKECQDYKIKQGVTHCDI